MHFETTVEIDAPPEKVWTTLVDVDRWPEWTASVTKVERLDGNPSTPVARARVTQPKMRPLVWEVTDLEPGKTFTWRNAIMGVTTIASHEISPIADDRVTVTLGIDHSGALAPIVGLLTGRKTRRYVGMEARGLKQRCET